MRADQFSHSGLDRLSPSVLRSNGMTRRPEARRSLSGRRRDVRAVEDDVAAGEVGEIGDGADQRALAVALDAGDADDLAAADGEGDVVERGPLGVGPGR